MISGGLFDPMCSTVTTIFSRALFFWSHIALAKARDSIEPIGKSPGLGPESVAGNAGRFASFPQYLPMLPVLLTVCRRCDRDCHGFREPIGQFAVSGVALQFVFAHALEQFVEVEVLTALDPLTLSIDFRVRLNRGNYCRGSDFHFPRLFDDALQRCPHIALALLEKAEGMRMPIDRGAVCKPVLVSKIRRALPV